MVFTNPGEVTRSRSYSESRGKESGPAESQPRISSLHMANTDGQIYPRVGDKRAFLLMPLARKVKTPENYQSRLSRPPLMQETPPSPRPNLK